MDDESLLSSPGPVPVTAAVREAMAEPMGLHRAAGAEAVYDRGRDALEFAFERSTPSRRREEPARGHRSPDSSR